jgi:hypothetical protein
VTRRAILLAVTTWLAVVCIGGELTWLVVGDAGRRVSAHTETPAGGVPAVNGVESVPSAGLSTRPTARPKPRSSRTHPTPTDAPATHRVSRSPAAPPRRKKPAASGAPSAGTSQQTRTWRGEPGTVTASCQGSRISLRSTSPADGWRAEPDSSGPQRVVVTFKSEEREVDVRAVCSRGVPRFDGESD